MDFSTVEPRIMCKQAMGVGVESLSNLLTQLLPIASELKSTLNVPFKTSESCGCVIVYVCLCLVSAGTQLCIKFSTPPIIQFRFILLLIYCLYQYHLLLGIAGH